MDEDTLNSAERLAWEAQLLREARTGERAALSELYRAYAGPLFARVLMPKLGNREAAEDALSETFRLGFERIGQFEERGKSIYYWFARIATNKAMDMHRARKVTCRAIVNLEAQIGILFDAPDTPDALLSHASEQQAFQSRLNEALTRLNPRYKQAVELRFFGELSREQCAAEMDVKLGTFDVLLLRAIKGLRKEWDKTGADGPAFEES